MSCHPLCHNPSPSTSLRAHFCVGPARKAWVPLRSCRLPPALDRGYHPPTCPPATATPCRRCSARRPPPTLAAGHACSAVPADPRRAPVRGKVRTKPASRVATVPARSCGAEGGGGRWGIDQEDKGERECERDEVCCVWELRF